MSTPNQTSHISHGQTHDLSANQAVNQVPNNHVNQASSRNMHLPYQGVQNNQPWQNGNPFYVCRIYGNISRCNGCMGAIEKATPPNDLQWSCIKNVTTILTLSPSRWFWACYQNQSTIIFNCHASSPNIQHSPSSTFFLVLLAHH